MSTAFAGRAVSVERSGNRNPVAQRFPRRALLLFAEQAETDRTRRHLPRAAAPLLEGWAVRRGDRAGVDLHVFGSHAGLPDAHLHPQSGRGFCERFQNAIETLSALGYEEIVVVGRDCPELTTGDIAEAFVQLRDRRLVLGPDHRGGCYLIAFRAEDRALLHGIRWKQNTDCIELAARCLASEVFLLAQKHDLDSWADLQLLAQGFDRSARLACFILGVVSDCGVLATHFVDLAAQCIRIRGQMPPPAFSA